MRAKKADQRRKAILQLIEEVEIEDQQQIVDLLLKKFKLRTTQAVISRDLHQLGVVKHVKNGRRVYRVPKREVQKQIFQLGVVDIQHNEAMIVITTERGLAMFISLILDSSDLPILGTLAGENVVFVVPESVKNIPRVTQAICDLLDFSPES